MNSPDYKAMYESWSEQYLKLKALYTTQSIALDKAEQEIKRLEKVLKEIAIAPEWQPIDYSLANTGQAPFDGKDFIGRYEDGFFLLMKFGINTEDDCMQAETCGCTYWMPVPEFMKG